MQVSLRCKLYPPSLFTTATAALAGSVPVLRQPASCRRAKISAAHRGKCQMQPQNLRGKSRMKDSQPAENISTARPPPTTPQLQLDTHHPASRISTLRSCPGKCSRNAFYQVCSYPRHHQILFRINCFALVFIPVEHQPHAVLKS